MFDEYKEYKVISNNTLLEGKVPCFELVEGSALTVFEKARDYVHIGWTLLNHPLYGNFTPRQQPYRTILLGYKVVAEDRKFHQLDLDSLQLIESSIHRFSSALPKGKEGLSFEHFSQEILNDLALMDLYLVSVNLERYGIRFNAT